MKLEEKIAYLRKKNGWSQEELAFRLDVSRQAVSKWEMGASLPDLDNVLKMSEIFGCSTDYLLKDDGAEKTVEEKPEQPPQSSKPKKTVLKLVEDLFWLVMTLVYLLWSFLSGDWHITWLLWPVAGIAFAMMELVVKIFEVAKENKRKK
ncbi:MAG: helix-turn-helix transcriptional regulator [Clostridia bacterium]|nr:helix-turn-helix transcriptional regulator [Clostridia bacterium]